MMNVMRSLVNVSKPNSNNNSRPLINTLRVASFSYVNHNNEHNVGAPPPRSPPKVNLTVDDPIHPKHDTRNTREQTEDTTNYVTEKAKRGTKGVVETAFNAGAAVAEGMEKSWGGIKETTHKIKESVLGEDEDDTNEKRYKGNMREGDEGYVDKNIEDLRRKAGGYDKRSNLP